MRKRYFTLFLIISILVITPRAGIAQISPLLQHSTSSIYLVQATPPDAFPIEFFKRIGIVVGAIGAILMFLFGVPHCPGFIKLLHDWDTNKFRKHLGNSLHDLDNDNDLKTKFKERLKTTLAEKIFDESLKECCNNLELCFKGQSSNRKPDLEKAFKASIKNAINDDSDKIFNELINVFLTHLVGGLELDASLKLNKYIENFLKQEYEKPLISIIAAHTYNKIENLRTEIKEIKEDIDKLREKINNSKT